MSALMPAPLIPMMTMGTMAENVRQDDNGRGAASSASLTPAMFRFMLALQSRLRANPHVAPTYEELRIDLGLSSKSGVARLVDACEKRGRIKRIPNVDRSIVVVDPVSEEDAVSDVHQDLISSFSNAEIFAEIVRRGMLKPD